jgi:hypothetical protein
MPSPFPGMDPYLESPRWFHGFHNSLIIYLQELLQPLLPSPYYAQTGQQMWLEMSQRYVDPDVHIMVERRESQGSQFPDHGGVAVAEPVVETEHEAGQPVMISVEEIVQDEHGEWFLEIHGRWAGQDRLIATIEVVSPSNKSPGQEGFAMYRAKQREVLAGQAHLIEIDLSRAGTHVTAVPEDIAREKAGSFDYHVSVHRSDRPKEFMVYPIRLRQRLPVITIPLLPSDPPVQLDLQAAFNRAYEAGPYGKTIWYRNDPIDPPLTPEQAAWAATRLKAVSTS